jgi:hypothetical protein
VAGAFYPAAEAELRAAVETCLHRPAAGTTPGPVPKALIAPHAGYVYSGTVAGSAYRLLAPAADTIRRVVLLGPSHRVAFRGLAVPSVAAFSTPLGDVPLDREVIDALVARFPQVAVSDQAHAAEHSLEVHLPFLQCVLRDFSLVPLSVGEASPEAVAQVIEAVWGGRETLIVVSTDLSHYLDYATACKVDRATAKAIEELRFEDIAYDHACGRNPVRGLLAVARRHGLVVKLLDLRNSGDTAGGRDRVVGYAACGVFGRDPRAAALLRVARESVANGLATGQPLRIDPEGFAPELRAPGASFVTLNARGQLRGCVGSLEAARPLVVDVAQNAFAAAFRDGRFAPLTHAELYDLVFHISVLGAREPMAFASEADLLAQLRPGVDGLVIEDAGRRATFLPQVWESLPEPRQFLAHLKAKAGLAPGHWSDRLRAFRYRVTEID